MDERLLAAVRQAAEEEDETLSAFLAEAARERVALLGLGRLLDEWERENGPFTDEEMADATEWLHSPMRPEDVLRRSRSRKRSA
jgi:hypothetical protein